MTIADLFEYWNLLESDFQREYNIDLLQSDISWRRFLALLGGLSQNSVFFTVYNEGKKNKRIVLENATDIARDMALQLARK